MFRKISSYLRNAIMPSSPPSNPLIVVLGATGTGKSQLAVELATRFNGEIINGDAMQMYDGLPIITNKISVEEQCGIPHHLLGQVGLDEETWTVGVFRRKAGRVIEEIRGRGRVPVLVGGTHYYTQSLLFRDAIVQVQKSADASVGNDEREGEHVPKQEILKKFPILNEETDVVLQKLREVDPVMADRWHPNDRRKILRSLEIWLTTGRRASDVYEEQRGRHEEEGEGLLTPTLLFWVHAESDTLKARLDKRVDAMLEAGLLDEVKSLERYLQAKKEAGVEVDRTRGIWVSIGYKEFEKYLGALREENVTDQEIEKLRLEAIESTKAATRQYAKSQVRWIRIKLLAGLSEAQVLSSLYLVDGSDVSRWNEAVSSPAMSVTEAFLAGGSMPAPADLGPQAAEILTPSKPDHSHRRDLWIRQTCELCGMTAVTQEQWLNHNKSRQHRRMLRKAEKRDSPYYPRRAKTGDAGDGGEGGDGSCDKTVAPADGP